jgi:hypothetical protein
VGGFLLSVQCAARRRSGGWWGTSPARVTQHSRPGRSAGVGGLATGLCWSQQRIARQAQIHRLPQGAALALECNR